METQERKGPITGREGAEIPLDLAAEWTKNYRERRPNGIISQFFGAEIMQRVLQQPGCLGLRIYYSNSQKLNGWQKFILAIANFFTKAVGAVGEDHFIVVGSTAEGKDILPGEKKADSANADAKLFITTASTSGDGGVVAEQAHPCPGSAGCPKNALTGNN